MKAAVIEKPGDIRVGTVDDPTPGRGKIVVKVGACGICGTDLHIADGEFPPTPYPIVPGHELAGEVVALGPDVSGLAEGQRVAVDPSLYCGHCRFCRVGKGNLCENWDAIGDTVSGGFAEYVAVPAANAYAVPEGVSYRQLALRGNASSVAVADLSEERLTRARRLGATSTTTDMTSLRDEEELGFDCVIDATGVPQVIEASFDMVKRGGKLLVFGVAPVEARVVLSPFRIYNDEITVLGSMAILNSYAPAVDLIASGAFDADALLTETMPLDEYPAALDMVRRGEGLKTQVLPNGSGLV